jgi:hypothetical protein
MKKIILLVLAVSFIGYSCKNSSQTKQPKLKKTELTKEEIKKEVEKHLYPMPTLFEITNKLNEIQVGYILTLSNDPEKVKSYFTEKDRALNLGVYSADLCYAGTYQQKQEAILYVSVIKQLLDNLGASASVDMTIVDKIKDNINDKEKLVEIITNSYFYTHKYLLDNKRFNASSLLLAGGWIEGMYITTNITENSYSNPEIITIVLEQQKVFYRLISELEKYKSRKDVGDVLALLQNVKSIYDSVKGGMTSQQMKSFIKEIAELRASIVK